METIFIHVHKLTAGFKCVLCYATLAVEIQLKSNKVEGKNDVFE